MKRVIRRIHKAVYEPIADLITYRAMPTQAVPMNAIDPFIFLNHHGRQVYPPNNNGLPFGPHPHRGFETVTFILEGDLTHMDTSGANSVIKEGGVQWMTAGKGLIHAEISSEAFKKSGGPLEILQLWVNLPAQFKMVEPRYKGLQKEDIPQVVQDNGKVIIHPVSGNWFGTTGPVAPYIDIELSWIELQAGGTFSYSIASSKNIFLYVVKGEISINDQNTSMHHLVEFAREGEDILIQANSDAVILFGHATPFNEPLVASGPFVMNTKEEINMAYNDYKKGLYGNEAALDA